jgi:hypothetical protein
MGSSAETAIVDFRLSFCELRKLYFHFSVAANKRKLPFSVNSVFHIYIDIETAAYTVYVYMLLFQTENGNLGDFH